MDNNGKGFKFAANVQFWIRIIFSLKKKKEKKMEAKKCVFCCCPKRAFLVL